MNIIFLKNIQPQSQNTLSFLSPSPSRCFDRRPGFPPASRRPHSLPFTADTPPDSMVSGV
ncbi:hypothetical protein Hanom_Chr15g01348731 [Helianthus anomalus]